MTREKQQKDDELRGNPDRKVISDECNYMIIYAIFWLVLQMGM